MSSLNNRISAALLLATTLVTSSVHASAQDSMAATLPAWQTLEFEEKAFWATAHSRLEVNSSDQNPGLWNFTARSSVPGNSEEVSMQLEADSGRIVDRERLSQGKKDKRFKSYVYSQEMVVRERREPANGTAGDPMLWPLVSQSNLPLPTSAEDLVVTTPYLLPLIAQRLTQQGPGATTEVLVHTDQNFYRATLTCGSGIRLNTNYRVSGKGVVQQARDTIGVAIKVEPEGDLVDKDDFSLLGLYGDLILFFDRESGLLLQVRGEAPRIGATEIDLKAVAMRPDQS